MDAILDLFAGVMAFFYELVPSYTFAIVMETLIVMIIVTPLTLKGTRSMMVMQQLQPEIKKIQTQYKDDRQRLNEELMKFYKENNLNPVGGCLPLLVQMPVFFVLYQVLRGLTRRESGLGFDTGWISGQLGLGDATTIAPVIERPFDPAYLKHDTSMYQSLNGSTTMPGPLGMDLAESAQEALGSGLGHAIPYFLLIALVGATGFIQQRQIQGRTPGAQVNPQQQMIMKIMPFFLPLISFTLPAGLVVYFAVSNLYRIGQQAFISRSIYGMSRADMKAARAETASGRKNGGNGDEAADKKVADKKTAAIEAKVTESPAKKPATSRRVASKEDKAKSKSKATTPAVPPKKSGRVTPKAGRDGSGAASQPTLQPRARKNKKR